MPAENKDRLSLSTIIQRLRQSEYLRHISVLFSGTAISSAIPFATAPIVSRLYSPADYGLLGTYVATATILGMIADGQYHHSIVTETDDQAASTSLVVSFLTTSLLTSLTILGLLSAIAIFPASMLTSVLSPWLWFLPISCFLGGLTLGVTALATRSTDFRSMASARVTAAFVAPAISITAALAGFGPVGLFAGLLLSQFVLAGRIAFSQRKRIQGAFQTASRRSIWKQAKRARKFPLYTLPSALMNNTSQQMPIWILTQTGLPAQIGHFSRARQLVSLPLNLLSSSVGDIFKQRASKERAETGSSHRTFQKTSLFLFVTGVPAFLFLFLFAPSIFAFFLGAPWRETGEFVQILCPMFFLRYMANPVATMLYIAGRQREDFFLHILLVALTTGVPIAVFALSRNVTALMISVSAAYGTIYLIYFLRSWSLARQRIEPAAG